MIISTEFTDHQIYGRTLKEIFSKLGVIPKYFNMKFNFSNRNKLTAFFTNSESLEQDSSMASPEPQIIRPQAKYEEMKAFLELELVNSKHNIRQPLRSVSF